MTELTNQQFKDQLLAEMAVLITTSLQPVIQQLGALTNKVDVLEGKVDSIQMKQEQMHALQQNSLKSRQEALIEVPNQQGYLPSVMNVEFPLSLNHLLVAGNERLPTTNEINSWNKRKSQILLAFYGASEGYESETDNEYSSTARSTRFKLAKVLGISSVQLQQAAASLADF